MTDIAIRTEGLSKSYRIGERQPYVALRDVLSSSLKAPFQRLTGSASRQPEPSSIWALKDVSFEVHRGEALGVIGRNGAGKSTLLKVLSRVTKPTAGYAELRGKVASLLEVGTGFHPELTGRENVYLNGAMLGMKRADITRTFDSIVAFSEVERFVEMPVKHYSSGMYLRLAFAVAAHLEPDILIVDEVLAVGDTAFQKRCLEKMRDVTTQGRTVLLVSHQTQLIQTMTSRSLLLEAGTIEKIGPTYDVVATYLKRGQDSHDLSGLPASGTLEGHFEELRIFSNDTISPAAIPQGQPLGLNFNVITDTYLSNAAIALAVRNSDGLELFSHSWLDQHPPLSLRSGCHKFEVEIPTLNLRPGPHWLTLCLTKNYADTVALVSGIELPPITLRENADLVLESRRWGVVQIPCDWRHR
jgi:lipopolysaccharide transport system ATP-binding protein